MKMSIKVTGLKDVNAAILAAFPNNIEQRRRILNQGMKAAAKGTILASAKRRALRGGESGALSESMGLRASSKSRALRRGVPASVIVGSIRNSPKALAMYINHYYITRGRSFPVSTLASGIRHGHLIEFGTVKTGARPFLYPALQSQASAYRNSLAGYLKKKMEAAVRRRARR